MAYRNAGNLPQGAQVGPLTPYQRPLVLILFLILPVVASLVLGWFLLEGEWFQRRWKTSKHSAAEVKFDTIETVTTANELLLQFTVGLHEFDTRSRELFQDEHYWIVDGRRADTPAYIYSFVQKQKDEKYLERYYKLSMARLKLETKLSDLENKVDHSVSSLPEDATTERIFRAERLIRKEIMKAADELRIQRQNLESLGGKFNKGNVK